jgi:hypothetical protein
MRSLVLAFLLMAAPVRGEQTYPGLVGMFTHAAGYIQSPTGRELYAWGHEGLPAGCANRYTMPLTWNGSSWTGTWSGYEQFCVVGGWVRLMGYGSLGLFPWFAPIVVGNEDGQRYAPVQMTRVAFCETGEIRGAITLAFSDCQTWAPTPSGWSQHETFQYLSGPNVSARFTSISLFEPRDMYKQAWRHWEVNGVFSSEQIWSVETYTW